MSNAYPTRSLSVGIALPQLLVVGIIILVTVSGPAWGRSELEFRGHQRGWTTRLVAFFVFV